MPQMLSKKKEPVPIRNLVSDHQANQLPGCLVAEVQHCGLPALVVRSEENKEHLTGVCSIPAAGKRLAVRF